MHRVYDAETGVFLSRDPILDGRNWYAYGDGNPNKWVDWSGGAKVRIPPPGQSPGPGWKRDTNHKSPNGERWISLGGEIAIQADRAQPGDNGFKGQDHGHVLYPQGNGKWKTDKSKGKGGHILIGTEITYISKQDRQKSLDDHTFRNRDGKFSGDIVDDYFWLPIPNVWPPKYRWHPVPRGWMPPQRR